MEFRTNWGIVVAALVLAAVLICAALLSAYYPPQTAHTGIVVSTDKQPTLPDDATGDWRSFLGTIAAPQATTIDEYRAPAELGTSAAISQELVATYFKLQAENKLGSPEAEDELVELIKRNVHIIGHNDTYTLSSVRTSGNVTPAQYAEIVGSIMQKSTTIRTYELTTFAETLRAEDHDGTPELKVAATIYENIEQELVNVNTPQGMATAHLDVVKAVAYLAYSVRLMAEWSGDPVDALSYIDAFVKADRETRISLDALFAALLKAEKQS